jgi:hypothetical protein
MSTFVTYDPAEDTKAQLVNSFFTGSAGVVLQTNSIVTEFGSNEEASPFAFYDGSISGLGIGSGLLISSGSSQPPLENTDAGYTGVTGSTYADADLLATVQKVFPEQDLNDVAALEFHVNVTDPNAVGLQFNVVFASEEYPTYIDDFVDVAGVYVNGQNYALFNNSDLHPLSVLSSNVDAGFFRDNNTDPSIGIEYNGVSIPLQITAPIHQGDNVIKIAVADTGDDVLDSAIFISAMHPVGFGGFGLATPVSVTGTGTVTDTGGNQAYSGSTSGNTVHFGADNGQDTFDGQGGIDEAVFDIGLAAITAFEWNGSVLTLHNGTNATQLTNVEHVLLGDGTFAAIDMQPGDVDFGVYAMLYAGFHTTPTQALMSFWMADAEVHDGDLGAVGDDMISTYAPGLSSSQIIAYLYHNIVGTDADAGTVAALNSLVTGENTLGDLFAAGAQLALNTDNIASVVGSIQMLDHSYFV